MTLDEAIKRAEEVVEANQRVIDTGIVFNDVTIDMLYCDDTEVIEEHLAYYQRCVEEYRQLAEWLKDYKRLLEQESKTAHWIYKIYGGFHEQGNWYCSHCDYQYNYGNGHAKFCPECGYEMSEPPTEEVIRDKDYDWIRRR